MPSGEDGSVTGWIGHLKASDHDDAGPHWDRYFERFVRSARARLPDTRRPSSAGDEEDATLSAFDNRCQGAFRGRFPRLEVRPNFRRLSVRIPAGKAADQVRARGA